MDRTLAAAIAVGALLVLLVFVPTWEDRGPPAPSFDAVHWDSRPVGADYVEVFEVRHVTGRVHTENVTFTLDGEPLGVTWAPGGTLEAGTRFSFYLAAFDFPRTLAAHADGRVLWQASFGSGAGTPI